MGVAALLPTDVTAGVDALRRASRDRTLGRVPAHITLLPPVNVRAGDVPAAEALVRDAAATAAPFTLLIGPGATFHPVTPVAYLAVGGDVDALVALRAAVRHPPLRREERFPYTPHVTLVDGAPAEQLLAVPACLPEPVGTVRVDAVHLLEELAEPDGVRRWRPVLSVPLGAAATADRGGVRVALLVERHEPGWAVVARAGAVEVGRATAWPAGDAVRLLDVSVVPAYRGVGIGRLLVQAVLDHADLAVLADDHPFLRHLGFADAPASRAVVRWGAP